MTEGHIREAAPAGVPETIRAVANQNPARTRGKLNPTYERHEKWTPLCGTCKLPLVNTDRECPRCKTPVPWEEAAVCTDA